MKSENKIPFKYVFGNSRENTVMFSVALSELSSHRVGLTRASLSISEDSLVESLEQTRQHGLYCLVVDFCLLDVAAKDIVEGKMGPSTVNLGTGGEETVLCSLK